MSSEVINPHILNVCRDHFVNLVVRNKVTDYLVIWDSDVKCQMSGCRSRAVRRVLVLDADRISRRVSVSSDGSIIEEGFY